MNINKEINLEIYGLGIIMYSDFAIAEIIEGEDYFSKSYQEPSDVERHIKNGTIVGFCTSSSGDYILNIKDGYPNDEELNLAKFKIRLGIEVRDNRIIIRDLYDLMEWKKEVDKSQIIELENGYYHITLYGDIPSTGILGDEQVINIYLNKLKEMPMINHIGVPIFSE